jgi:hypothetical protein
MIDFVSENPCETESGLGRTAEPVHPTPNRSFPSPDFRSLGGGTGGVTTAEMTVDAWIALPHPSAPAQYRPSLSGRASQAGQAGGGRGGERHLAHVVAARLEGNYYKIGWSHPKLSVGAGSSCHARPFCTSRFIQVSSRAELDALYEVFDASTASKTRYDQVYGGYQGVRFPAPVQAPPARLFERCAEHCPAGRHPGAAEPHPARRESVSGRRRIQARTGTA